MGKKHKILIVFWQANTLSVMPLRHRCISQCPMVKRVRIQSPSRLSWNLWATALFSFRFLFLSPNESVLWLIRIRPKVVIFQIIHFLYLWWMEFSIRCVRNLSDDVTCWKRLSADVYRLTLPSLPLACRQLGDLSGHVITSFLRLLLHRPLHTAV